MCYACCVIKLTSTVHVSNPLDIQSNTNEYKYFSKHANTHNTHTLK